MSAFDWRGPSKIADLNKWMRSKPAKKRIAPLNQIVFSNKHNSINTVITSPADKTKKLLKAAI